MSTKPCEASLRPRLWRGLALTFVALLITAGFPFVVAAQGQTAGSAQRAAELWRELAPALAAGDNAKSAAIVARDADVARALYRELLFDAATSWLYGHPGLSKNAAARAVIVAQDSEARALEAKLAAWTQEQKPGAGFQRAGAGVEQAIYLAALAKFRSEEKEGDKDAPAGTARELTTSALALAESSGLELAVACFSGNLAVYALRESRLAEAPPLVARAAAIWERWRHPVGMFQAPQLLGYVAFRGEKWQEAAAQLALAAERAKAQPDLLAFRVSILSDLAAARRNAGDREGVRAALASAAEGQQQLLAEVTNDDARLKNSKALADFQVQLGGALAALGRHSEAGDYYVSAEKLKSENYKVESAKLEAQLVATQAQMEARIAKSTTEEQRKIFRGALETVTDSYLSMLDGLASTNGDTAGLAKVAGRRVAVARAGGNPSNIARALGVVADAQRKAGDLKQARAAAEEALALRQTDPRRTHIYDTLALLGDLAYYAEDWSEAIARYKEVIAATKPGAHPLPYDLAAQPDESVRRVQARMNDFDLLLRENKSLQARISLGLIYERQGNYRAADEMFGAAEADIPRLYAAGAPDGDELRAWLAGRKGARTTALDVAEHRRQVGFTPDADEQQRAEFAELAANTHRSSLVSYRAILLEDQNDLDGAAKLYEQAFNMTANLIGGAFTLSGNYVALARIERERGNYAAAEAPIEAALAEAIRKNDPDSISNMLAFQSALRRDQGRLEESRRLAEDALKMARGLDSRAQVAGILRTLGRTESDMGGEHLPRAEAHLREALALWRELGLRAHVPYTLDSLGVVLEKLNREDEALAAYIEGVSIIESLTVSLAAGANAETFNASRGNRDLYDHLIKLLIKRGRASEALQYLERSKSKSLVDALAGASVTARDPALRLLLERVRAASETERLAEKELTDELARPPATRDASKLAALRARLSAAHRERDAAVERLKRVNPSYASLVSVKPTDLDEARKRLPEKTLLISYFPTDTDLYIFVVTRDAPPRALAVKKTRAALSKMIAEYRAEVMPRGGPARGLGVAASEQMAPMVKRDPAKLRELTARLYETLLAPAQAEIERADTILLVPAGDLYYMPVHALGRASADGSIAYLIESKRFAYLASADLLNVVAGRSDGKKSAATSRSGMLAIGNPDGSLPGASEEVATLSGIFPKAQIFTGDDATMEQVARPGAAGAPFVHFATHGVINSRDPKESYLLLAGRPGRLTVRDLVEDTYKLSFAGTRLVTLSACETNLGGWDPSAVYGSLSRAFSKAGAPTVIASLWSVSDDSTRDTMTVFYRELTTGQSKAEAMRRAQLSILRDPRYQHPFYWAPFVILGEWK